MIGRDPLAGPREKGQESGTIVPGEVEAVIEFAEREGDPVEGIIGFAANLIHFVDAGDRGQQFFRRRSDHERNGRVRKFFAERSYGRSGEDKVADPFELKEQNVHGREENAQRPTPNAQFRISEKRNAAVLLLRDSAFGVGRSAFSFTKNLMSSSTSYRFIRIAFSYAISSRVRKWSQVKLSTTRCRAASLIRSTFSGCRYNSRIAAANSPTLPGWIMIPSTPSFTTSPASRVVICGRPQAAASYTTFALPSHCDGKTWTVPWLK